MAAPIAVDMAAQNTVIWQPVNAGGGSDHVTSHCTEFGLNLSQIIWAPVLGGPIMETKTPVPNWIFYDPLKCFEDVLMR